MSPSSIPNPNRVKNPFTRKLLPSLKSCQCAEGDGDEPTRPQSLPPPTSRKSTTRTGVSKRTVAGMVCQHSHLACPHPFSDVLAPGTLNTDPDSCSLSTCIFTDGVGGSDHRSPGEGGLGFSRHKGLEAQSMKRTLNGSSELPKPRSGDEQGSLTGT